jgi:putative transposase
VDGRALAADGHDARAQAGRPPRRAGRADARDAEKKAADGRLRLGYLDECGFSPSQPTTLTWARRGERKRIPYENPQGRRLNVLALATQGADAAGLYWRPSRRHLDSDDLLHFLRALPPAPVPTVVVLDNAGLHRSKAVRAAAAELRARRIYLYYLPPYSPELNDIERLFRTVKHHELPERRYPTFDALDAAVVAAFERQEAQRLTKPSSQPRKAA